MQCHKEENIMNWKRVISGVLAAAMLSALPVYSTGASKLVPVKLRGTLSAGREYYLSDTIFR